MNWQDIIVKVAIYTTDLKTFTVHGKEIHWEMMQMYPSCQSMDLFEMFNMEEITPKMVKFYFKKIKNYKVKISMIERNKACSRRLNKNLLMYAGPPIDVNDLSVSIRKRFTLSLTQTFRESFRKFVNFETQCI